MNQAEAHVFNTIFGYLRNNYGASYLAKFSVVTGPAWEGRDNGGEGEYGEERMVHRELLQSMAPFLPPEVDQIILPEDSKDILHNLTPFSTVAGIGLHSTKKFKKIKPKIN